MMRHKNLVSIVIATHNRANLVAETLDSILAQNIKIEGV